VNSGTLAPAASPAVSNVFGSFTQTSTDTLSLKLGPAASGTCTQQASDTLAVTGAATLGGTLNVTTLGCTANTSITLLTFPTLTGRFATTNLPPRYVVNYLPTNAPTTVVVNLG
jgi:hypothetical protein